MRENPMLYKVSRPNGRWKYGFDSVESAIRYASQVYRITGTVAAIESYQKRK